LITSRGLRFRQKKKKVEVGKRFVEAFDALRNESVQRW
jgi:hypothetical protein